MARRNKADVSRYNKAHYEQLKQDSEWYAGHLKSGRDAYYRKTKSKRVEQALKIIEVVRENDFTDKQELAELIAERWSFRERRD